MSRTSCVQSSHLSPWCKHEDKFATAWLPCQSLAGQVHHMLTQCTHTTHRCFWFDVGKPVLASWTTLHSPLDSSLDCSDGIKSGVSAFSNLTVSWAVCASTLSWWQIISRSRSNCKGNVAHWEPFLSKLCVVLSKQRHVKFLRRNNANRTLCQNFENYYNWYQKQHFKSWVSQAFPLVSVLLSKLQGGQQIWAYFQAL